MFSFAQRQARIVTGHLGNWMKLMVERLPLPVFCSHAIFSSRPLGYGSCGFKSPFPFLAYRRHHSRQAVGRRLLDFAGSIPAGMRKHFEPFLFLLDGGIISSEPSEESFSV